MPLLLRLLGLRPRPAPQIMHRVSHKRLRRLEHSYAKPIYGSKSVRFIVPPTSHIIPRPPSPIIPHPPSSSPPGSNFHEADMRNPFWGVPGQSVGPALGNSELRGGGPMYAIVYPWVNIVVVSIASPLTITGARIALAGLLLALGKLEHAWANQKYCQTSVRIRSPDRRPRAGSILGEPGPTNPMLGAPGPIMAHRGPGEGRQLGDLGCGGDHVCYSLPSPCRASARHLRWDNESMHGAKPK